MVKKRQITIGGVVGAGKTTAAKIISEILDYNFHSVGSFRRKIAEEKFKVDINKLNALEEAKHCITNLDFHEKMLAEIKHLGLTKEDLPNLKKIMAFDTDILADNMQKDFGIKSENFIIEGRLAWKFCPDSFKVFLACDPFVAAERIFNNPRKTERIVSTIEDLQTKNMLRMESDKKRYLAKYGKGYDCYNPLNFDLIINTTSLEPKQVVEKILSAFDNFYEIAAE
ncbi:MAG: cytidylate kinase family protein [Nanoarchaeota archaeon]|nr:cytidylate kinase family protein [Nanoarchaeota archaeon]